MAVSWQVMVHLYDSSSQGCVSGYYKLVAFPPHPTYLFEFVGVYPQLQYIFILFEVLRGECSDEQFVGEDHHILVIGGSLVIVWSFGQRICSTIVLPWYML